MADRRKLAAGNWKMNGTSDMVSEVETLLRQHGTARSDLLLCPPATLLDRLAKTAKGTALAVGGQDCHAEDSGAHTGDISAAMLVDAGASHVILGHSERRADHGETDADVQAKARAARQAGLTAIVCVGETLDQRDAGEALAVIERQIAGSVPDDATAETLVVAYEPVWAIGTGKVAGPAEIEEVHTAIRRQLRDMLGQEEGDGVRILYGGSVKPDNASEIFAVPDVDGALVGGASLKAADFGGIVDALDKA